MTRNRTTFRPGAEHPNWAGGRYMDREGYRRVLVLPGVYKKEHIVVMERHIGRSLIRGECVHHVNGVRDDNRIENLQLMTVSEHGRLHNTGSKHSEATRSKLREMRKGTNQKEGHQQWRHDVTEEKVRAALLRHGRQKPAAQGLGINVETLRARIKHYGIRREEWAASTAYLRSATSGPTPSSSLLERPARRAATSQSPATKPGSTRRQAKRKNTASG